jgi:putative copper resistance protein D
VIGAAVAAALLATVVGLALTGAAAPSLLFDPGPGVRWGLPLVTVIGELAAALTLGVLVLTCVALPVTPAPATAGHTGRAARPKAFAPGLNVAAAGAGVWTVATGTQTVLAFAQLSGTHISDPAFGAQLFGFVRDTEAGRGLAVTVVVAALLTLAIVATATVGTTGLLLLFGLVALIPPALAGHSAGSSDHETAVTSLGLHLVGVCVWVGGLAGLVLLRGRLAERGPAAVAVVTRRYSTLALWAFVLVALSGTINAAIRVPTLSGLATSYGVLLLLKVSALALLGVAGLLHRRRALPDLDAGVPGTFARLAAVEALIMGIAIGLAGALAASAPPSGGVITSPTPAQAITGYPLPPPPTPMRWLTSWQPDLFWLLAAGVATTLYVVAAVRLHRRGDRWPVLRVVNWLVGMVGLVYVTSGPPAVYGRVLFSAHMLGHMSLSMVVPMFLVLGAPVMLALRALPPRRDGSRGPREWLVAALESRYARILSFPPVAAFLFAGSLVFFYFSPLFEIALRTHIGHELMHVHFLFAGYLFAWVLIGLDPAPGRISPPLRLITLLVTMTFHAFFGVTLLSGKGVLAASYFGGLGRTWGSALLMDQHTGGGIAWGIGDVPAIGMALAIAIQWARSDDREARRRDRAADRDGDAELTAYNEMLARIAATDARRDGREV